MMRNEKGFALIITLLVTALLVALSVEFIDDVYVGTSSRQNFVDAQQASLMANSGVEAGIKLLQLSTSSAGLLLPDPLKNPIQLEDEKGRLVVTIIDESGKLNLNDVFTPAGSENSFYHGVATRLLKNANLPLDLLDALSDWRDDNDTPAPGGAESSFYMALKQPYIAKNSVLESVEELALVKGFSHATVEALKPLITVYPVERSGIAASKININTAPIAVLAALTDRMNLELAKQVDEYREKSPFKNISELGLVPGVEVPPELQSGASVTPSLYRIVSEATVRETTRTVEAVVPSSNLGQYLYWREF
ncbi:type II secretion system minor pseudopilin GspK [Geobacter sp. DSM 9736]|uniref:type II secretion system minor pseudopilin GspK n=1 Tax=Geobacter sp. DSM 9736 TaxID=1277350 RepID=UPI000B604061|nr:type II secretion system minor pseudopilin GspK [Geobacter sp. DSM 9736]SNB47414.1 type II secretion system protein K (GspK) [Geobacter sp. DSM 9736]